MEDRIIAILITLFTAMTKYQTESNLRRRIHFCLIVLRYISFWWEGMASGVSHICHVGSLAISGQIRPLKWVNINASLGFCSFFLFILLRHQSTRDYHPFLVHFLSMFNFSGNALCLSTEIFLLGDIKTSQVESKYKPSK